MPSNLILFEKQLQLLLNSKSAKSVDEFADKFSTILDNSIKHQATTQFGNTIISTNKMLVKNGIQFALNVGFKVDKYKIDLQQYISEIEAQGDDINIVLSKLEKIPIPFFSGFIKTHLKKIENLPQQDKLQNIKSFIQSIKIEDLMWFYVASQISLYFLTAKFSPTPPNPPSVSPSVGTLVVSPGNILEFAFGLKYAFKSKTADETATKAKLAIEYYIKTISGIYTGVTATGIPSITPWVGIF